MKFDRAVLAFLASLLLGGFADASQSASGDGRRVKIAGPLGSIVIEAENDDVIHFEAAAPTDDQDVERPLPVSAMLDPRRLRTSAKVSLVAGGLQTKNVEVRIDAAALCATVMSRADGREILRSCPFNLGADWKGLTIEGPRLRNLYGLGNYFQDPGTADGDWVGRVWDPLPNSYGNSLRPFQRGATSYAQFPILYGFGEAKDAFALLLDSVGKQMWTFNSEPYRAEFADDRVRWFAIAGADAREVRRRYMELTGKPPLPPKRIFGLWVSQFGYSNWTEAYDPVVSLRANGFPLDGLGMDLQWFGGRFFDRGADTRGSRMGALQFDESAFPNFRHEAEQLRRERGVNLMLIEESYVSKFLPEHERMARAGFLARSCATGAPVFLDSNPWWGVGGLIDWTNPAAGDAWHDEKRQPLYDLGITDHWTDLGEPEMFDPNGCYFGGRAHPQVHNQYNLKWVESIARGYERHQNLFRPTIMSRSGTSGLQRFGAGMWSGDIAANMASMTAHYRVQSSMSWSGIDYFSSDVGGFHRRKDTLDGDQDALFTQWLANAALFDFPMRSHVWNLGKNLKTSPDQIGDLESNRFNVWLRYKLAPYYYSLAWRASNVGDPVVPPMAWAFPEDANVRTMGNQKMIGPFLMGAILARYGQIERDVYLPRGTWIDFHTGDWRDSAGEWLRRAPNVQDGRVRAPLFARAGAILPMAKVDRKTMNALGRRDGEPPISDLSVRVYASAEATSFDVYEDDGETTRYRDGARAITRLAQRLDGARLRVDIGAIDGAGFAGLPASRNNLIEAFARSSAASAVSVNGASLEERSSEAELAAASSGWTNAGGGRILVKTGPTSVRAAKSIAIDLRPAPPLASINFICRGAATAVGEAIFVSGSIPELGGWAPERAVRLAPSAYPDWSGLVSGVPAGARFEWKCLKRREAGGPALAWQSGSNRFSATPASGGFAGAAEARF